MISTVDHIILRGLESVVDLLSRFHQGHELPIWIDSSLVCPVAKYNLATMIDSLGDSHADEMMTLAAMSQIDQESSICPQAFPDADNGPRVALPLSRREMMPC